MNDIVETIRDVLGLAGDGSEAINALFESAKIIKGFFGATEHGADPQVKLAIAELVMQIAEAKAANADLVRRLSSLATAYDAAQERQADFDRYALWKSPTGSLVYRVKDSQTAFEPTHFLCPNCRQNGLKSILQGDEFSKRCHPCKAHYSFDPSPERQPEDNWLDRKRV